MKLTAEEIAEITGLTPGTVREYARRMGLGKKEGRRKYYTKAEAKQIESGELPKAAPKKPAPTNKATAPNVALAQKKSKAPAKKVGTKTKSVKKSR